MTAIPWVSPLQVAPEGEGGHYSGDAERIPDPRSQARRGRIEATAGRSGGGGGHYSGEAERIPDSRSQARRGRIEAWGAHRSLGAGERERIKAGAHRSLGAGEREGEERIRGAGERADGRRPRFFRPRHPTTHGPARTQHLTAGHNLQAGHLSEKTRRERAQRTLRRGATHALPLRAFLTRHVPPESLWCEQRAVAFKKRDTRAPVRCDGALTEVRHDGHPLGVAAAGRSGGEGGPLFR
jgi:hypothetical protein